MRVTIIDISLPIHPAMPVYPGNQMTKFDIFKKPSGSQLTSISFDSHTGTHIDAPSHAGLDGDIESFPLELFYGECRVIEILHTPLITKDHLSSLHISAGERILFRTDNSVRGYDAFYDNWTALSSDAAEYLASRGVRLVGIDWFGIKQKDAADNGAHTKLLEAGIPVLEGLNLKDAATGTYLLSAFPISYQHIDGAQTRAVLIQD